MESVDGAKEFDVLLEFTGRIQLAINPLSNNVGHVKHYVRTPLHALVEERHFALVDGVRFPTWARF